MRLLMRRNRVIFSSVSTGFFPIEIRHNTRNCRIPIPSLYIDVTSQSVCVRKESDNLSSCNVFFSLGTPLSMMELFVYTTRKP